VSRIAEYLYRTFTYEPEDPGRTVKIQAAVDEKLTSGESQQGSKEKVKKEKEFGRRLKSTLVLIEGPRRRISLEALWTTVEHVIRPLDADAVAVIFSLTPKAEVCSFDRGH